MATPITSKRFTDLLSIWGIRWSPIQSTWATHNRNHKGEWNNLNGVMMHHTGAFSSVSGMNSVLWSGYAGLPGPLCHAGIDPAGILRLAGWGRANHAGLGDDDILRLVRESKLPRDKSLRPNEANTDGNAHFYGFEIMADGKTPMTEAQRISAVRVAALLCREHKWGADVIGHGEWQPGKWDPGANGKLINMGEFRTWVDQAIKEGPKPVPTQPKPIENRPIPTKLQAVVVKDGDTLTEIARDHLGDGARWPEIVQTNPHLARPLRVGEKLFLPKR